MKARSDSAYAAVRRGHVRMAEAELLQGGTSAGLLPIEDGDLTWTLSDADGIRGGRITVPGYSWYTAADPGNRTSVTVRVTIEGETWDLGNMPVMQVTADRPRGTTEIVLGDWSYRRSQPGAEVSTTIGATNRTVASVVAEYMGHVMPGGVFTITRDDSNGALVRTPVEVQLGTSVWGSLTTLANQVGCIIVATSKSTGEIRRFDPLAPYHDDLDGLVISETAAVVVNEAINRVVMQAEASNPGGGTTVYRAVKTLTTGSYKYDADGIGRLAHAETARLPVVTQATVDAEAQRVFERRAGIVRSQQVEVVPVPWLEPGDVVAYTSTVTGGPVYGLINSMNMPLTARGTQQLILREARLTA